MDTRLIHAQALKSVGGRPHLTALRGQRGEATCDLLVLSYADLTHLPGFLPGWGATQGGQAQRDAIGILALAHAVVRGQAEK